MNNEGCWWLSGFVIGVLMSFTITAIIVNSMTNSWWERECVRRGVGHYEKNKVEGRYPYFEFNLEVQRGSTPDCDSL